MTLCEGQLFITFELYFFNYLPLYTLLSYTLFCLIPIKIDNNPFTANKITIILVSKPTSAANIFIVRHGELVQ